MTNQERGIHKRQFHYLRVRDLWNDGTIKKIQKIWKVIRSRMRQMSSVITCRVSEISVIFR